MCCAFQGKVVAAVCHGPAAFTEAELDGKPLVKDKKVGLDLRSCSAGLCMAADLAFCHEECIHDSGLEGCGIYYTLSEYLSNVSQKCR